MHSYLNQISALLNSTPINSLKNNELYGQLPISELFSSLLSQYSSGSEDANFAALSGNFVPAVPVQSSLTTATKSLIDSSSDVGSEVIEASAIAPALPATLSNIDPVAQVQNQSSTQLQQAVAETVSKESLDSNVAGSKNSNHESGNLSFLGEDRSFSKLPPIENSKPENFVRPSSSDQLFQPVNHQNIRESQNDSRINSSRSAESQVFPTEQPIPAAAKLNVRELQSEVAIRAPATTDDAVIAKTKQQPEPAFPNNSSLSENSFTQNKSTQSQASTTVNAPINILDPRERLLAPVTNSDIKFTDNGQLADRKFSIDTNKTVESQPQGVINRPLNQDRVAFDTATNTLQREQETSKQFDATDVRKENIIASTTVRDQNEYTKQIDNRVSLQHKLEDLYRVANTQDRPAIRQDYSAPVQQNFIVESAPVVKIVEINIDQKTPVTINIGADAVSSLKPVNTDYSLLPPREILQTDSSTSAVKASEIRNGNEIAEQITWARQNNAQHVRISVTPEHLGAVDISIDDAADGLNIQFVAQNLQAKEALELFMPRLKEMLEQSGLNLQNANVSQQGEGRGQFNLSDQTSNELVQQDVDDEISVAQTDAIHNQASNSSDQLLDAFA